MINEIKKELNLLANKNKADVLQRFFKTGKGQYGEGDKFLGIKVPDQRKISRNYVKLNLKQLEKLLQDKIHEYRLTALLILVQKYEKEDNKKELVEFYINNLNYINNWDLVDLTAPKILGDHTLNNPRKILYDLATSENLWKKRVAIISTFTLIRNDQFEDTLKISEILLNDPHDLIHKAVGWMLREVGKRNQLIEEEFLEKYHKTMPRTMLRYAIERFDKKKREHYMRK